MAITFKPQYNGFCFSLNGKDRSVLEIIEAGEKPTIEEQGIIQGQIINAYSVDNVYREWANSALNKLVNGTLA